MKSEMYSDLLIATRDVCFRRQTIELWSRKLGRVFTDIKTD